MLKSAILKLFHFELQKKHCLTMLLCTGSRGMARQWPWQSTCKSMWGEAKPCSAACEEEKVAFRICHAVFFAHVVPCMYLTEECSAQLPSTRCFRCLPATFFCLCVLESVTSGQAWLSSKQNIFNVSIGGQFLGGSLAKQADYLHQALNLHLKPSAQSPIEAL